MSPPKQGEEDNRWTSNCVYCVYFQSAGFPIGTLFRWDAYSNNAQWHLSKRKCGLSAGLQVHESLAHLSMEVDDFCMSFDAFAKHGLCSGND